MFDVNIFIHDSFLCCTLLWKESLLYYILLWLGRNLLNCVIKKKDIAGMPHFEVLFCGKHKVILIFIPSLCPLDDKGNLGFPSLLPVCL